jgi:ATP phosphoribosyltransferase
VTKIPKPVPRTALRMGLPSKGRMAEDTIQLLKVRRAAAASSVQQEQRRSRT